MATERFTKQEFEAALPSGWKHSGLIEGEHEYKLFLNGFVDLLIRSSIAANGRANESGEDSIRLWLSIKQTDGQYQPMKRTDEMSSYTTRIHGWERRLGTQIDQMRIVADRIKKEIPVCADCGHAFRVNLTKKEGKNKGRPFASCRVHNGFIWMDEETIIKVEEKKVFGEESQNLFDALMKDEPTVEIPKVTQTTKKTRTPNAQQAAIINAPLDVPIRVLAGPGSGKTSVLEKRIRYLIENGAEPASILYVTFTKTMADEGKNRIVQELSDLLEPDEIEVYARWFCTIHAACYRILKEEGLARKELAKDWKVKSLVEKISEELWPFGGEKDPNRRPPADEIVAAINYAKAAGLTSEEDENYFVDHHGDYHGARLHKARTKLDRQMQAEGLITFADMLYETEQLLANNRQAREKWQSQFQYILIDEGQDTNSQAIRILAKLAEPQNRIAIVGDVDQVLMRFMGGEPEANLYGGFTQRYPEGKLYFMETNYRSTNMIVNAANQLISHNYEKKGGLYSDEYYKVLTVRTDAAVGQKIGFVEYEDALDESEGVAKSIAIQLATGYKPNQFFVAARTKAQLGYLENALMKEKVPFINIKGGSFWLSKHVQHTVNYLRLAVDENNSEAFKSIYNVASVDMRSRGQYCNHRWLGNAFLTACDNKFRNVWRAVEERSTYRSGVTDLTYFVHEIQDTLSNDGVEEALRCIIDRCYQPWLLSQEGEGAQGDESESGKLSDLETVVDIAKRFKTPQEFFRFVDDAIEAANKAKDRNWDEFVVLSTIHGLKGLERDVVYGVGISEGENDVEGKRYRVGLLPHTFSLSEPPKRGVLNFTSAGRLSDERCAGFVLITRARHECYLSSIRTYRTWKLWPSRFIYEAGIVERETELYGEEAF